MIFPETSFLVAVYRLQDNSPEAASLFKSLPPGVTLSPLVVFEFENTLQLQTGLFRNDRTPGFPERVATGAVADFRSDMEAGFWRMVPIDWPLVFAAAGKLSRAHTAKGLHRAMDILHVATAVVLRARTFLTFDARQATLAKAAGLKCPVKIR